MKKCFLCHTAASGGRITEFNDESIQKCKLMLLFRRKKNFKYNDITLNSDTAHKHGYHLQCYKKFTVLSHKYKEEFNYCKMLTVSGKICSE